jgi:hypothetical protein
MNSEKSSYKVFLLATAKIGLAIFVAVLALAILGISIFFISKYIENNKNKPLKVVIIWPQIEVPALKNAKLTLISKWEDSLVHYQFSMSGYPAEKEELPISKPSPFNSTNGAFTIIFLDENRFKVVQTEIPIKNMSRTINEKGHFIGLQANDSFYMSADNYRKIKYWDIAWRF